MNSNTADRTGKTAPRMTDYAGVEPGRATPQRDLRGIKSRRVGWGLLLAMVFMASACPAQAEYVIDKIRRTGTLNAGARVSGIVPFSFKDETGTFKGFSIDILSAIHLALERELGMPIKLNLYEVDAETRFSQIQNGELAIVCDATTPTRKREEIVDFSVTTFLDGVRLMVDRSHSTGDIGSLKSPRVGTIPNSTAIRVVQEKIPTAEIISFPNLQDAFASLEAGNLDAIVDNNVILRHLHRRAARPGRYSILPLNDYLSVETFACIVPENDSRWRNFVDSVIINLMKGIESYRGEYYDTYKKWFKNIDGVQHPINRDAIIYFKNITEIYGD